MMDGSQSEGNTDLSSMRQAVDLAGHFPLGSLVGSAILNPSPLVLSLIDPWRRPCFGEGICTHLFCLLRRDGFPSSGAVHHAL